MRIVLYHSYNVHSDYPRQHLHYLFEPSLSLSTFPYNPNYLQNQESDSVAALEIETKEQSPSPTRPLPFIKKILVVDDDPDLTLTFKVILDGYCHSDRKRF